jgi:hypothetical protein
VLTEAHADRSTVEGNAGKIKSADRRHAEQAGVTDG